MSRHDDVAASSGESEPFVGVVYIHEAKGGGKFRVEEQENGWWTWTLIEYADGVQWAACEKHARDVLGDG